MGSSPQAQADRSAQLRAERAERKKQRAARQAREAQAREGTLNILVWSMMGIAIWHFAIFVPDRFKGGIVGAFGCAAVGAVIVGVAHLPAGRSTIRASRLLFRRSPERSWDSGPAGSGATAPTSVTPPEHRLALLSELVPSIGG